MMAANGNGNGHGNSTLLVQERKPLGQGLLGDTWFPGREDGLAMLCVAYASIADVKAANFKMWHNVRASLIGELKQRAAARGLTASPFVEDAFWARLDKAVPPRDAEAHVALFRACMTDYTDRLADHIQYRMRTDGNVHLEFTGPTGMGKSSCAMALADWISRINPDHLDDHLSFDLGELPRKLKGKRAGQTVIQDEYVATAGEGSKTFASLFANLEDTLRASQVNLFALSPREQEFGTMQARLEVVLWNPEEQFSVFLCWLGEEPHGLVALPWVRKDLWEQYSPWKANNVRRSLSGHFKDTSYLARAAVRVFQDDRFVQYLVKGVNKPKKKDFQAALGFFYPEMMTMSQTNKLVDFLYTACYGFDRLEDHFEDWWGIEPGPGFREVAERCYKE